MKITYLKSWKMDSFFLIVSPNQGLICCVSNRGEKVSMCHFKKIENGCKNIILNFEGCRNCFSGEPPFRVCSKCFWANLLFWINRTLIMAYIQYSQMLSNASKCFKIHANTIKRRQMLPNVFNCMRLHARKCSRMLPNARECFHIHQKLPNGSK